MSVALTFQTVSEKFGMVSILPKKAHNLPRGRAFVLALTRKHPSLYLAPTPARRIIRAP